MIDYVNPVKPIMDFLRAQMASDIANGVDIVGGMFSGDERGPALSIKLAGGAPEASEPYSRIQLLARCAVDYEATALVVKASNVLARSYDLIQDLRVKSVRIETRPIDTRDSDTQLPESWVYVIVEHMEA